MSRALQCAWSTTRLVAFGSGRLLAFDLDSAFLVDDRLLTPDRLRDMLGVLDSAFADFDLLVDHRALVGGHLLLAHRNADRRVGLADRAIARLVVDGTPLDRDLFVCDRDVDGALLGDDLLGQLDLARLYGVLARTELLLAELEGLLRLDPRPPRGWSLASRGRGGRALDRCAVVLAVGLHGRLRGLELVQPVLGHAQMNRLAIYRTDGAEGDVLLLAQAEKPGGHTQVPLRCLGHRADLLVVGVEDIHAVVYLVLESLSHATFLSAVKRARTARFGPSCLPLANDAPGRPLGRGRVAGAQPAAQRAGRE